MINFYGTKKMLDHIDNDVIERLNQEMKRDMGTNTISMQTFYACGNKIYTFNRNSTDEVEYRIDCAESKDKSILGEDRSQGYKVYYLQLQDNSRNPSPTYANVVYPARGGIDVKKHRIKELIDAIKRSMETQTAVYISY